MPGKLGAPNFVGVESQALNPAVDRIFDPTPPSGGVPIFSPTGDRISGPTPPSRGRFPLVSGETGILPACRAFPAKPGFILAGL
jgi:hypothetical protein